MALAFSLLAALLAIFVQQWVRDYMHIFQRYGDPLKSARLRQYLYEGCERWYMPRLAEAVPGFLHLSLFLFFAGLVNSLLKINTKVALSTIIPIGLSGLLYIFTTFAPVIYPQSPYQNLFSSILWYLIQKLRGRKFRDRGSDGEMKSVSTNMAQGQMQLAMEETVARQGRDIRAIRWLIDNLTEDAEMEKFLSAIPGSFNTDWGTEVWKRVSKHHGSEGQSQEEPHSDTTAHRLSFSRIIRGVLRPVLHLARKCAPHYPPTHVTTGSLVFYPLDVHPPSATAHIRGENVVYELSTRVARSVALFKNRNLFADNDGLWQKRTRACIETAASLVCCANANLVWFGGISGLLGDIGGFEKIRELSLAGMDQLFVIRWTCLSLVAIQPDLAHMGRGPVTQAMKSFARGDDTGNNNALTGAQKIDETLQKASDCLFRLYNALHNTEDLTEEVKEIISGHESEISELEQITIEADHLNLVDYEISIIQNTINRDSCQITSQIPGILDNLNWGLVPFSRFVELSHDPRKMQFIRPSQTLKDMCSPAMTLRNIIEDGGDADAYKELLKDLEDFRVSSGWQGDVMQRQLWRLQDLRDGGVLGFTVELFFLALSQLLSTSSSEGSHSALYTGTFRAITSDWSKHKYSLGTQKLLLDIAISRRGEFEVHYPSYIVDEFLFLLGNIFEGQTGPHIDKAKQQFESFGLYGPEWFSERVLRALTS